MAKTFIDLLVRIYGCQPDQRSYRVEARLEDDNRSLRLRLEIDSGAAELYSLRWERLHLPYQPQQWLPHCARLFIAPVRKFIGV